MPNSIFIGSLAICLSCFYGSADANRNAAKKNTATSKATHKSIVVSKQKLTTPTKKQSVTLRSTRSNHRKAASSKKLDRTIAKTDRGMAKRAEKRLSFDRKMNRLGENLRKLGQLQKDKQSNSTNTVKHLKVAKSVLRDAGLLVREIRSSFGPKDSRAVRLGVWISGRFIAGVAMSYAKTFHARNDQAGLKLSLQVARDAGQGRIMQRVARLLYGGATN